MAAVSAYWHRDFNKSRYVMPEQNFVITKTLLSHTLTYLSEKPYKEVFHLIEALRQLPVVELDDPRPLEESDNVVPMGSPTP